MSDSTPTAETFAQLIETMDERAAFCGCPAAIVRDRVCVLCSKPNLQAMIEWRADECTCSPPDNLDGMLRSCRSCEKPVFEVIKRPQRSLFRRS